MSSDNKALLIEDDDALYPVVEALTTQLGYRLEHHLDGRQGLKAALTQDYSFIICDYHLPGLDGLEICKQLRSEKKEIPFIMLTSQDDELSKVLLLECGADDYIVKPFSSAELKARIKAVLRRSEGSQKQDKEFDTITIGELQLDMSRRLVWMAGEEIHLTFLEFEILATLASRPGHVFSRGQILESLNSFSTEDYERGLTVHITRIRGKLGGKARSQYLMTVRGVGYRLISPSEIAGNE